MTTTRDHHDSGALILAAGGIIERQTVDGPLVALVYRELYGGHWSLPKGKQDPGESLQETALREVWEETGCRGRFIGFAGVTHYWHGSLPKVVFYWHLALVEATDFKASDEVARLAWLSPAEAVACMAYDDEKKLLKKIYRLKG